MIDMKQTSMGPSKSSTSVVEAISKPTAANVKSFAALKMKSKLEKSSGGPAVSGE